MTIVLALVFSLLTALTNAASATLQWDAAAKTPAEEARGLRLAASLVRRPEYLAAVGALTLSFLLQAAALHEGEVALVQPLLVTELPFTLFLSSWWLGLGLERREIIGAAGICAGLGLLLGGGHPHGGHATASPFTWAVAVGAVAVLMLGMVLAAGRQRSLRRTILFALSSGLAYSLTAILVKATTEEVRHGIGHLVSTWEPYGMIAAGVGAVLLQQKSLQAGTLAAAKPATTIINPLASIILAVAVFGERLRGSWYVVLEAGGILLLVGGILETARSPLVTGHRREEPRHEPRLAAARRRTQSPG